MTARALLSEKSNPSLTLPRQTAKNKAPVTRDPILFGSANFNDDKINMHVCICF